MTDDQPLTVPHASRLSAKTESSSMKLVLLNTWSITRHADDITSSVYLSVSDVAAFTETRLSSDSLPQQLQHKRVLHVNAPRQRDYGVAVVVSSTIFTRELFRHSSDICQLLVVQAECSSHCVIVVTVYRSPVLSMADFKCTLKTHIEPFLHNSSHPVAVVGDFNIDARQSIALLDVTQYVTSTTHTDGGVLDRVYWTGNDVCLTTEVIGCHWSDHNIVAVRINNPEHDAETNPPSSSLSSTVSSRVQSADVTTRQETTIPQPSPLLTRQAAKRCTVARRQRNLYNVVGACRFLDGALCSQRLQLDISVPVHDIIKQYCLEVHRAPGNGHCLLYSWAAATQLNVQQAKDSILQEYRENAVTYSTAGVTVEELQHYVSCQNYNLQSVDAVFDILCNASNVTAFVIGQEYDYSDPQNVICIPGCTEIRRISTTESE